MEERRKSSSKSLFPDTSVRTTLVEIIYIDKQNLNLHVGVGLRRRKWSILWIRGKVSF